MKNSLTLKIYDIDYSFIIKNYLNEKLWDKEWTIFIYKKFQIVLGLKSINVRTKTIDFEVTINDSNEENKSYWNKSVRDTFSYNLSIDNINILKKQLNSTILRLIERLEVNAYIEFEEEYQRLEQMADDEKSKLIQIAEEFLDDENVNNSDIREAYVDWYVDKNEEVYSFKNRYISERKYNALADFYLIFLEACNNQEKLKEIKRNLGQDRLAEVLEEIKEYEEYMETEEFIENMQSNLESL